MPNAFSRLVGLVALSVLLGACFEEEDLEEDEGPEDDFVAQRQTLGASCTIQRPYGWMGVGIGCVESQSLNTPITIPDGHDYPAVASQEIPVMGVGSVKVHCANGQISERNKICSKRVRD